MELHFRTWIEDAGHTTWQYSNASEPGFDEKIPSKYMARDFKPKGSDDKKVDPEKLFGSKRLRRMKKKMK